MKLKIFIILILGIINVTNIKACSIDCDINVDSLFQKNISMLKGNIIDTTEYIVVENNDNWKFLFAVSFLSGINTVYDFHTTRTTVEIVAAIENWYNDKKEKITCERVKKAYLALEPPCLKNIEEIEKYTEELEKLKIE
jgi:hypothetical protein